jgi:Domain of unknown function (DUF4388)
MADANQPRTVLEGDLAVIQLPDVLSFLAMIRGSGKLVLRQKELERSIFWKDGEVVFATSNSFEHTLGQFLLRNGRITPDEYEQSRQKISPQMRHGKILVQMGAISPKDLWWGVKNQAFEIIYSLFSWKEGHFSFLDSPDELTGERIVLQANASSVIMEGVRRLDESARIRERISSLNMVFDKTGETPNFEELEMSEHEIRLYEAINGRSTIRDLIRQSETTEFEATRIMFQLLSARLIEEVEQDKTSRPVFLDVEDSPELLGVISTYNSMFARLFESLGAAIGEEDARETFMSVLQTSEANELWTGVLFDQRGRFDENLLMANISELPFEERRAVLEEGLNTLLSIQLFEVSQHLDAAAKVEVFRYISDQKARIEEVIR